MAGRSMISTMKGHGWIGEGAEEDERVLIYDGSAFQGSFPLPTLSALPEEPKISQSFDLKIFK